MTMNEQAELLSGTIEHTEAVLAAIIPDYESISIDEQARLHGVLLEYFPRPQPAPTSDDLLVEARDLLQAEWDNGAKYQPKAEEFARVITKLNERLGVSDEKP